MEVARKLEDIHGEIDNVIRQINSAEVQKTHLELMLEDLVSATEQKRQQLEQQKLQFSPITQVTTPPRGGLLL